MAVLENGLFDSGDVVGGPIGMLERDAAQINVRVFLEGRNVSGGPVSRLLGAQARKDALPLRFYLPANVEHRDGRMLFHQRQGRRDARGAGADDVVHNAAPKKSRMTR